MATYENLVAWRRAHALVLRIYTYTKPFPSDERCGLTSQVRRAALSIAANLAEGAGRNGDRELARFARIALGSANEVHYLVRVATDLGHLNKSDSTRLQASVEEVRRVVSALVRRLERDVGAAMRSNRSRTSSRVVQSPSTRRAAIGC